MAKAKFQVTINNIAEDQLGPILGGLPDNLQPEIRRISGRNETPIPGNSKTAPTPKPPSVGGIKNGKAANLGDWIRVMPPQFRAKDLVPVINANGYNGNSIGHFLRRAAELKLIAKVPGHNGSQTLYKKL